MAIDWSKIEGFREDMTPEEKLELLENQPEPEKAPAPDPKSYISKAKFDEVSSQVAALKKELKGRMSEDEQKELERQTKVNEMETELNELRREKKIASYKASYLAQGFEEKLADQAAVAMVDGDSDTVFSAMQQHQKAMEAAITAKLLKDSPRPPAGDMPPTEEDQSRQQINAIRKAAGLPPIK